MTRPGGSAAAPDPGQPPDPASKPAKPPVFLERQSYRRRRLLDAVRLLPVVGGLLLAVPMLWPSGGGPFGAAVPSSQAMLYLFGVWAGLIVLAALLGALLQAWVGDDDPAEGGDARFPGEPPHAPGGGGHG